MTFKIHVLVSYKLHIMVISLAAILVVTLSTGVVEALLNVQGGIIKDPIFKPINFTVTNTSADPITVTTITIVTDNDRFKFKTEENLSPGEDFFFAPEIGPISGIPKVTILAEKTFGSMSDPDDPGKLTVSFIAPAPEEEPSTQVDFLSAIRSSPETGTVMGVIIENTSPDTLKIKKIKLPKVDSDPGTEGIQPWVLKIRQNLAADDSLKMKFNVEDVDSNPIVLDDGQKVKVKLITKTNDGMRFKVVQKVIVNEGIGTSP